MNADAELDAALGRQAGVALDHAVLHLDGATHRIDHASELDEAAVAGALHHAAVMGGDRGIDQIAAQRPEPRERAILIRARQSAIADDVGRQDRGNLPGLAHGAPLGRHRIAQMPLGAARLSVESDRAEGSRPSRTRRGGFGLVRPVRHAVSE